MEPVRSFIAVDPGEKFHEDIKELEQQLYGKVSGIRWVEPNNVHLTLKFLGTIPSDLIEKLVANLKGAVEGLPHFELRLAGAGVFPDLRRPRVFWIGASSDGNSLQELEAKVSGVVSSLGIPTDDKPFRAHLTIGRFKDRASGTELKGILENTGFDFGRVLVDRIFLFRSTLTPKGPVYSVLSEIRL
jgi:2'-5' RNA ligase